MLSKAKLKYVKSLEQKKMRLREGMFVAEGPKVVADLMAVYEPRMLFAVPSWIEANASLLHTLSGTEVIDVTNDELRHLSFLQHPQQVLGVFQVPGSKVPSSKVPGSKVPSSKVPGSKVPGSKVPGSKFQIPGSKVQDIRLVLDSVQDPGNLGTIIRIADWFGITDIICSRETADVWNPKVVQATMGSIARVSVSYTDLCEYIDSLPHGTAVYGTMLDGDNIHTTNLVTPAVIVMGNEGNGISPAVAQRLTHKILIPNYPEGRPTADSLNVAIATAITCFAFRKG